MKIPSTVLKLQRRHDFVLETATYKVQRSITQKVYTQELWFLHSARRLMLVNICIKFHEDTLNGFQVTEGTRFCDGQTDDPCENNTSPNPKEGRHNIRQSINKIKLKLQKI